MLDDNDIPLIDKTIHECLLEGEEKNELNR